MEEKYTLVQTLENGVNTTSKRVVFEIPRVAGTYSLTAQLSNGKYKDMGSISVHGKGENDTYHLTINKNGGGSVSCSFKGTFGLIPPVLSNATFSKDNGSNTYGGNLTVTNKNNVPVTMVVWYLEKNSSYVTKRSSKEIAAGGTRTLNFSGHYCEGILVRVHFVDSSHNIKEDEIYAQTTMGSYSGSYSFTDEDSTTTTTTTTTTTPYSLLANYQQVDSDEKFTLWREQNVE